MSHLFEIGHKKLITDDQPMVYRDVCFGNDVYPFMLAVFAKVDFNNAAVRCIAVRHDEESFAETARSKSVVDPAENRFRSVISLERSKIDVRECLFSKVI